jgi:hypothetical protein
MVVKKQTNCANCLEVKDRTELLDCARCRSVSYCSKDCQVIHWKKGGHKLLCVAVESSNDEVSTTVKFRYKKHLILPYARILNFGFEWLRVAKKFLIQYR